MKTSPPPRDTHLLWAKEAMCLLHRRFSTDSCKKTLHSRVCGRAAEVGESSWAKPGGWLPLDWMPLSTPQEPSSFLTSACHEKPPFPRSMAHKRPNPLHFMCSSPFHLEKLVISMNRPFQGLLSFGGAGGPAFSLFPGWEHVVRMRTKMAYGVYAAHWYLVLRYGQNYVFPQGSAPCAKILHHLETIQWMDKILHHFDTTGNHCLLVFAGENDHSRVS